MKFTPLIIILIECLNLQAQPIVKNFTFRSGGVNGAEVQSCVLQRIKRSGADSTRVLFSADSYVDDNKAKDFIYYYDIASSAGIHSLIRKQSKINIEDAGSDYSFGTNDHDLIKLPNGNIIFAVGCFSKKEVSNKPAWWDETFRGDFGPGARSGVAFWRSADGGETFSFQGVYDPLFSGPVFAASPQFRKNNGNNILSPNWDMGGSDGQVTKVLPGEGNKLFLTFGVVGYNGSKDNSNKYILDPAKFYNKTVLVSSDDEGKTWTPNQGTMDAFQWRGNIASFHSSDKKHIAMTTWNGVIPGTTLVNQNDYKFKSTISNPGNIASWAGLTPKANARRVDSTKTINNFFSAHMWTYPLIAKCPGKSEYIVGIPSLIDNQRALRVYIYSPATDSYLEMDPVLPATDKTKNMVGSTVFHPVMIESNGGPVLLYWTDIDENTLKYAVKGRIIYNNKEYSDDFKITEYKNLPATSYWVGDYFTAGSITSYEKGLQIAGNNTGKEKLKTSFYPIWFERGSVFFSEVSVFTNPSFIYLFNNQNIEASSNQSLKTTDTKKWKKATPMIGPFPVLQNRPDYNIEKIDKLRKPVF